MVERMEQVNRSAGTRQAQRIYAKIQVALIIFPDTDKIEAHAVTIDFTEYGVRVETECKLEAGQVVDVIPTSGLQDAVRSRVVWVKPSERGPGLVAGLEFLQPVGPGWKE